MKGTLRLEDEVACLDRDLVIYIQVAEPNQPRLLYEVAYAFHSSKVSNYLIYCFIFDKIEIFERKRSDDVELRP